jgi:hypothetical protein
MVLYNFRGGAAYEQKEGCNKADINAGRPYYPSKYG